MSSTNFRAILTFASCVVVLVIYYMGGFFSGRDFYCCATRAHIVATSSSSRLPVYLFLVHFQGEGHVFFFFFSHFYFPASGQAVVTGVVPSPPRFLPSIFIAHRVPAIPLLVHCSSSVLLTHALALSASTNKGTQIIMHTFYESFALLVTEGGFLWRGGTVGT